MNLRKANKVEESINEKPPQTDLKIEQEDNAEMPEVEDKLIGDDLDFKKAETVYQRNQKGLKGTESNY